MLTKHKISITFPLFITGLYYSIAAPATTLSNQPIGEITLAQAQALAEAQYPALQAARLESQAASSRTTQARARPNPGLSLETENFGGKNDLQGFDGTEYTLQLEQTMELGGKRSQRIRFADAGKKLAEFDLSAQTLETRAETAHRFVALQGAQERLALSKESLSLAQEIAKSVAARVRAGKSAPMEEDKAQILLAQQKISLDSAMRDLQCARVKLAAMWGSHTVTFDRAGGDLQAVPSLPDIATGATRMRENPDLARWATELAQRQAALGQEKARRIPDMTLAGGIRRFSDTESSAFIASLSIPLPLFDRNQGNLQEAALLLQKTEQQRQLAEVEASVGLLESYQTLAASLKRIDTLKNEVIPRSKSVFDSVQKAYAEGKNTYLDVLEARRTFFDARSEYLDALVSGHQAHVHLERLAVKTQTSMDDN